MPESRGDERVRRAHRLARGDFIYPPDALSGPPAVATGYLLAAMRRLSAPIASLIVVLAAAGCGGSSDDQQADLPTQRLIGARQENKYPAGSPQRSLMEYWAALQ